MTSFYSIFVLLCTIALIYGNQASNEKLGEQNGAQPDLQIPAPNDVSPNAYLPVLPPLDGAKSPDQLMAQSFYVASEAQNLFNYVLRPTESYKTLSQNINQLEQPDSQLSEPNAVLLGQIKTNFLNGFNSYDAALKPICELCQKVPDSLHSFLTYFNQSNPSHEIVKNKFLPGLANAVQKYGKGQKGVQEILSAFSLASSQLQTLVNNLKSDYNENSPYFKNRVNQLIEGSEVDESKIIAQLKSKLAKILEFYENYYNVAQKAHTILKLTNSAFTIEIQWLANRKAQIDAESDGDAHAGEHNEKYHNAVIHAAEDFIELCQEYLHQHP